MHSMNQKPTIPPAEPAHIRLFHVSEEPDIQVFEPRLPARKDLNQKIGLVWAIDEKRLPNFLTPRDCPRVAYHVGSRTTDADKARFFTSSGISHISKRSYTGMNIYVITQAHGRILCSNKAVVPVSNFRAT